MDANSHRPERSALHRDIAVVVVATVGAALSAAYFDMSEAIVAWTRPWEHLQLDEVPVVLVVLAAALAWFAGRRYRESRAELQRREAAETRLANLLQDNRRLGQQLLLVQESERKTLARELHDELGQYLNAIKIEAITIERSEPNPTARHAAAEIVAHADHVYGVVRDLIRQLRPVALDTLGLKAALEHHLNDWRQRLPEVRIDIALDDDLDDAEEALGLAVFRLIQEGMTNIARHARAQRVEVQVECGRMEPDRALRVRIVDDGRGADASRLRSGLGLHGMRERIEMLGGEVTLRTEPDRGFEIHARIPM
jgi:two-component system sensor histidine kinase UhpB